VSAAGGTPTAVPVSEAHPDEAVGFPFFLPDGNHYLYSAQRAGRGSLYVGSLDSPTRSRLLESVLNAQYAEGHLIFVRGTTLMAQRFDVKRLVLEAEPEPVSEQIRLGAGNIPLNAGAFSASEAGVLVYQGSLNQSHLVWLDRMGTQTSVMGEPADYGDVSLSPDGARAAVSVADPGATTRHKWIFDVPRGLRTRFTIDSADEFSGVWSPDGSRIAFNSNRKKSLDLYEKASSGAGDEQLLFANAFNKYPQSYSPDGRFRLYIEIGAETGQDLWVLPLSGDRKPFAFLKTQYNEGLGAQFSPDGHWIAYVSNESGRNEVYVAPFQGPGRKWQVSTAGGSLTRWRRDGRELFFLGLPSFKRTLMSAAVRSQGENFTVGAIRRLFDVIGGAPIPRYSYDVTADGQHFLVAVAEQQSTTPMMTLVVNWTAVLRK
jgi:Tol biopolymer transport system component